MKISFLPFKQIFAVTIIGVSVASLLLPQPTLAQSTRNILQDLDPQRTDDPLAPRSDEVNNVGTFGLMHRLLQGSTVWNSQQQDQAIDDAASAFKAKQEQLYQQQQGQRQINQPVQVTTPQSGK